MDMTGEFRIPAPREKVWEALNDPEILKASIPGCEELTKEGDDKMSAKVKAKVGPVSAKFAGKVTLSDINPPEGYKISGEGQGGVAGFAKGGAEVTLDEDGDHTILKYTANAQVGGKLAQIGSRLIDSTAKKMANEFFTNFVAQVAPENAGEAEAVIESDKGTEVVKPDEPADTETETPAAEPAKPASASEGGISPAIWISGLIAVVVVILLVFAVN